MALIDVQRDAAIERVQMLAQTSTEPVLTDDDVEAIVNEHRRASFWTTAKAYVYGDVIMPAVRNGHRYRCTQAGTSGTPEPVWPVTTGATITEGTSDPILTWEEAGPDYANVFDVRAAMHKVCMVKASKAALSIDTSGGVGDLRASQIYQHWIQLASMYASLEMA